MGHDPQELFAAHRHLARWAARRVARGLRDGRRRHRLEELEAAALWGLWRASESWDPAQTPHFETYARFKAHAAAVDWARDFDGTRRKAPRPAPRDRVLQGDADAVLAGRAHADLERAREAGRLVELALRGLRRRDREAVRLYWLCGLTLAEVGRRLGVGESQASVMVSEALPQLRYRLELAGEACR